MGWETRNGRQYFYRKVRNGDKIRSDYIGHGELARAIAYFEQRDNEEIQDAKRLKSQEKEAERARETEFMAFYTAVEAEFAQAMTAAGYHRHHRGEWRKQRGHKQV